LLDRLHRLGRYWSCGGYTILHMVFISMVRPRFSVRMIGQDNRLIRTLPGARTTKAP